MINFKTERLVVGELKRDLEAEQYDLLLSSIPEILTPNVVEYLPPSFKNVLTPEAASRWLSCMLEESRLLQVQTHSHEVIGFMFVYVSKTKVANIGYLFAEHWWRLGLATELLNGFVEAIIHTETWSKLVGGVERSNTSSAKLLLNLGFTISEETEDTVFYELQLI